MHGNSGLRDNKMNKKAKKNQRRRGIASGMMFSALSGVLSAIPAYARQPLPVPCVSCATGRPITGFVGSGSFNASTYTNNNTTLNIYQNSPKGILNWQNFDIAPGYTVNFFQPSTTSEVLNRIWDSNPSLIQGALNANGQVYLINANGIIFGKGAQVNVRTLIASSLDITDDLFTRGYLTNNTGSNPKEILPTFFGNGGFIRVDSGATINGSQIMMFAPVVENKGTINTADGQAILAAGTRVYLEASQDPNLRGMLVEVDLTKLDAKGNPVLDVNGKQISIAGIVDPNLAGQGLEHTEAGTVTNTNTGSMLSQRGNTTLIGYAVNQEGMISATTSVTENGSIKLLARYNVEQGFGVVTNTFSNGQTATIYDIRAKDTGTLILAKGSVTQVTPEAADTATTADSQGFNPSIIEAMGNTVDVAGSIIAPGAKVNLVALGSIDTTVNQQTGSGFGIYQDVGMPYSSFLNPNYKPASVSDGSHVILENGSLIDVSGSTASASVARNILAVQLRATELANSPLQRNGILYGQTVYIDITKGTPIANYSGAEAGIARGVLERTSTGGQVLVASSGDATMNPGASVNISGGQVNYSGALVNSTTLISNGHTYDISKASPNMIYDSIAGRVIVKHAKWGVTDTFYAMAGNSQVWDPGYVQGMNAGSVTFDAPNAAIQGNIIAKTQPGINQRQPYVDPATLAVNNYMNTWQMLPKGGTLNIGYALASVTPGSPQYDYVTGSDVVVGESPSAPPARPTIYLDPALFSQGLNNLAIYTNGTASIAAGLTLAPGGSLKLRGGQVNTAGSIAVAGGSVDLASVLTVDDPYKLLPGDVTVGGDITTRGTWVNDSRIFGAPNTAIPIVENGGSISVNSAGNLNVASGVTLDASGGAWVDQSGKIHGGNGGNISLAGAAIKNNASDTNPINMDSIALKSYGVNAGKGGNLAFNAGSAQIGGDQAVALAAGSTYLPASFFRSGGFTNYNIAGVTNVYGLIQPKSQSLILNQDAGLQATGNDIYGFSNAGFLPDDQRNPTSITLKSPMDLTVNSGAEILVDPRASITLNAANQLTVLGTLDAPAGTINLNLNIGDGLYNDSSSIWLGPDSQLLAGGYFMQQPNSSGLVQGQVLSGGTINIGTNGGFFASSQGSIMDVRGTSVNIDLPTLDSGRLSYQNTHVTGDAGSISIKAPSAFFDGTMKGGVEAGSQAAAGSFALKLYTEPNVFAQNAAFQGNPSQLNLVASGGGNFLAKAHLAKPGDSLSEIAGSANSEGSAFLDVNSLKTFDRVTLQSSGNSNNTAASIVLGDGVSLATRRSITLDAPVISVAGKAYLNSAHVTLGNFDINNQTSVAPQSGAGSLDVNAQLIDLTGNLAVTGVNSLNLNSNGDIRMNGVLDSSTFVGGTNPQPTAKSLTGSLSTLGDVTLTANQVYTSTLAQFAVNSPGTITVNPKDVQNPSNGSSPVLSAGGLLALNAANIEQNGVLKAPMGEIDLNGSNSVTLAHGSITSVSAEGQTIPFGLIQGGTGWYYDLTGSGQVFVPFTTPPQKIVNLKGPNISVAAGSTVDLSGGGNLYAYEFFAGTGGTTNVLDPATAPANTFAIMPEMSNFATYDPQSTGTYAPAAGSKTVLQDGAMVYLAGGNGLKAGYYSLLPASYALLPGAYRVTGFSGYQDMQPGQVSVQTDGTMIMAGKYAVAGTNIQNARWSGFAVSSGAIVRTQSEFHDSYANAFFAGARLPMDAGQLVVNASGNGAQLALNGIFKTQAATGGQGAWIDFNGPAFDIVNVAGTGTPGSVELITGMLDNLGAASLLIGGVRTSTASGMSIAVGAGNVTVENSGGPALSGSEIILATNNEVKVKAGSNIQGSGTYSTYSGTPQNISIGQNQITDPNTGLVTTQGVSGNGALLRVSSGNQVTVKRLNVDSTSKLGIMTVEDGAKVSSSNAVLLDATYQTNIGDKATLTGKALSVAASAIDIGNGSSATSSGPIPLALTPALLVQMQNFQDIALHSYGDINFYGAAGLGGVDANGGHQIANLTLNAASFNGINNTGNTTTVDAGSVTLMNNNTGAPTSATGSGALNVNANTIVLADGDKNIQGFDNVSLNAAQQITGQGTGTLTVTSSSGSGQKLNLQGSLTGAAKSDQKITATGYDIAIKPATGTPVANSDVGAKLAIQGRSITDSGAINLLSGNLTLHATTGDVILNSASITSAAGSAKTIAGQSVYAPAGAISLISDSGNVTINSGALVDVSGAVDANDPTKGGDAGSLSISATQGTANIAGSLKGSAPAGVAGSFTLDANSIAGTALTALDNLNALLMWDTLKHTGGFSQSINLRDRSDASLILNNVVTAQNYQLAADNGSITVNGKIDASRASGGNILLAAKNDVNLNSTLDAHGTTDSGGKVTLETKNGNIVLNKGAYMDVSGTASGTVHLRAPQVFTNGTVTGVAVTKSPSLSAFPVSAGANVIVEGFKAYTASSITSSDLLQTGSYYTDAQAFANVGSGIMNELGLSGVNMQVDPGIQISSTSDLTLVNDWDLSTWRFNGAPGILTLQAAGNLNFGTTSTIVNTSSSASGGTPDGTTTSQTSSMDTSGVTTYITSVATTNAGMTSTTTTTVAATTASLSDGFQSAGPGTSTSSVFALSNEPSWSYQLVAGADASAANLMGVNNSRMGSVILAPGANFVSPTTYKNAIVNGKRVKVPVPGVATTNFEVIRTGTGTIDIAAGDGLYLGNNDSMIYTAGQQATGLPSSLGANASAGMLTGGGNVNIAVKGDISAVGQYTGSSVNQLISDWQLRQGATSNTGASWYINFGTFAQNIGALGGGNVNISAGGNITSLSAVVPTSGYVDSSGTLQTLGGGNLTVKAGGNIDSGIFYVGNGQGNIQAGGSLDSSRGDASGRVTLYSILALGQGNINVVAGGDINLQTVLNPTMIGAGTSFFTYGTDSGVSLNSLNGNILLSNDTGFLSTQQYNPGYSAYTPATSPYLNPGNLSSAVTPDTSAAKVYPGTLQVTALNGSVNIDGGSTPMILFPSANGNLKLIAGADININTQLMVSDASANLFQPASPVSMGSNGTGELNALNLHGLLSDNLSPLHSADASPVIIAAGGNINGDTSGAINLVLPKAANIQAGQDIVNLSMSVQNQTSSDITSMTAGRDISFTGTGTTPPPGITVSGPGQLVLEAGRNIDLGQSEGLVTNGNLFNPYLPTQGAAITVLAGLGGSSSDSQAFIGKYIDPASGKGYAPDLASYIASNIDPSSTAGLANIPYLVSYFFDPSTSTGQANTNVLNVFVVGNGAPKNLTNADAYSYLKALPIATQQKFAYDFFKTQPVSIQASYVASNAMQGNSPDLISFVNSHGGKKVANSADATAAYNAMQPDVQNEFASFNFKQASPKDQIAFVNKYGVKQVATSADAIAAYNAMTPDVQNEFGNFSQASAANQISFVNFNGGEKVAIGADAYTAFNAMPNNLQTAFVNQVFFSELKQSGRSAITSGNYGAGYDTIATLFPATSYQGDLNLYYSQIKTLQGGDINILTPGGGVNAGLANPPANAPAKTAAELGVVTVGGGDVNAFVNNDFTVNQSRVFTLQGGNILMWSTNGNLDAGKGSKSVSSTPPPLLVVDPKTGTFTFDVTNSVVGSGIGVLLASSNTVPGAVDMFAPKGVINAGDAGIQSSGIINLGAQTIISNGNISAAGAVTGVPAATSTSVGLNGLSNIQDASKAADQSTQNMNNDNMSQMKNALSNFMPSLFSVDVIGLGGETYNP